LIFFNFAFQGIYASFDTFSPSIEDFSWCSQEKGKNELEISNSDVDFKVGTLFIGITCHIAESVANSGACQLLLATGKELWNFSL
jgi:hypothetical protein